MRAGGNRPVIPKLPGRLGDTLGRAIKAESTERRKHGPFDGDGVELEITLTGNQTKVAYHKLNRVPRGWLITDISATASFNNPIYRIAWDKQTLSIVNNNPQEIKLKVYLF